MLFFNYFISESDFLSVLGEVCVLDEKRPYVVSISGSDISFDFTSIFEVKEGINKVTVKSAKQDIFLSLSILNGLLDGSCSIKFGDNLVLIGCWEKGIRKGDFVINIMKTTVFRGKYYNGLRNGNCCFLTGDGSYLEVKYFDGFWSESSEEIINNISCRVSRKDGVITKIMASSNGLIRDLTFNQVTGSLESFSLVKNGAAFRKIGFFPNNKMIVYNLINEIIYQGEYVYVPPFTFFMHGQGIQYNRNRLVYKGSFVFNSRCGNGCFYYYNNCKKYEGQWNADFPNGHGTIYDQNGGRITDVFCSNGFFKWGVHTYSVDTFSPKRTFLDNLLGNDGEAARYNQRLTSSADIGLPSWDFEYRTIPFFIEGDDSLLKENIDKARKLQNLNNIVSDRQIVTKICLDSSFKQLDMNLFPVLEDLELGDSFTYPGNLVIKCHPYLKTITIHEFSVNGINSQSFSVSECPQLQKLCICSNSLIRITSFKIFDCNCLHTLQIGSSPQYYSMSGLSLLELSYLPALGKLDLSNAIFPSLEKVDLHHLPLLSTIRVGCKSMHSCKELYLRHLPLLKRIVGFNNQTMVFQTIRKLHIDNTPSLFSDGFQFNVQSFATLETITCSHPYIKAYLSKNLNIDLFPLILNGSPQGIDWEYCTSLVIETNIQVDIFRNLRPNVCPWIQVLDIRKYKGIEGINVVINEFPKLQSIIIRDNSLTGISSLEIMDNTQLQSITIADNSCRLCNNLKLKNLTDLRSVIIGNMCFENKKIGSFCMENLPKLSFFKVDGTISCNSFKIATISGVPNNIDLFIPNGCFRFAKLINKGEDLISKRISENSRESIILANPTPANPIPVKTTPVKTTPVKTTPANSTPTNSTPVTENSSKENNAISKDVIIKAGSNNSIEVFEIKNHGIVKNLVIGNKCLMKCGDLVISDLPSLCSITIGDQSLIGKSNMGFLVSNCNHLISIHCKASSLVNVKKIEFKQLPLLSLIHFFSGCFSQVKEFSISESHSLTRIDFPHDSMKNLTSITLSKLNELSRIRFGMNSCIGGTDFSICIQDCCNLLSIDFDGDESTRTCANCTALSIINAPHLKETDTLLLQTNVFNNLKTANFSNCEMFNQLFQLRNLLVSISTVSLQDVEAVTIDGQFSQTRTSLVMTNYKKMKSLEIVSHSCIKVKKFELTNNPNLVTVLVGSDCFSGAGTFTIENCPSLQIISIGKNSFVNYSKFSIKSLNQLEIISIGSLEIASPAFSYVENLSIESFPHLQTLFFGNRLFENLKTISLKMLPRLISIYLGSDALRMDPNYSNTKLDLVKLPLLEEFHCSSEKSTSLEYVRIVNCSDVQNFNLKKYSDKPFSNLSLATGVPNKVIKNLVLTSKK